MPVAEILRRVADNQQRADESRSRVVYHQSVRTRLMRGGGKLAREESRQYTVTPTATGSEKQLLSISGLYEKHGKLHPYADPKFRHKDLDLDGELTEDLTDDLVNSKNSRDGISRDLFPLTAEEQRHYEFRFDGYQKVADVDAIRLAFSPRKRTKGAEEDGRPWSGTVLIHPEEFQPPRQRKWVSQEAEEGRADPPILNAREVFIEEAWLTVRLQPSLNLLRGELQGLLQRPFELFPV
jgi:hypothetical protein